jgi:hypothetical protein
MKWKTLIGMAVASVFASGGAFAGSFNHGTEVQTPTSVNESAPWRALEDSGYMTPAVRSHQDEIIASDSELGTGASLSVSAFGTGGFDSSTGAATGEDVDYWRMDESSDVGSTTSLGSGSGSFSSSMSDSAFADEVASVTTYYGDDLALLLDTGISSEELEA